MYSRTSFCGAFRMHSAHILPKPAHFEYMAAISCHEGAFLPSEAPSGMHQGDILPGMRPIACSECASRAFRSKGAPSLSENALRRRFVQGPLAAQAYEG